MLSPPFQVNVESESAYAPERLLIESVKVMREKLALIKQAAEALREKSIAGLGEGDVIMEDASN